MGIERFLDWVPDWLPVPILLGTKKRLESGILSRDEHIQELEAYRSDLEQRLSTAREQYIILQRRYYKDVHGIDLPEEVTGEDTIIMRRLTTAWHHIDTEDLDLAEREIIELIQQGVIQEDEAVLHEVETRGVKREIWPEKVVRLLFEQIQDLTLKRVWYFKRYESPEHSRVPYTFLSSLYEQNRDGEFDHLPKVGDSRYVNSIMLEERVVGPDIYDLFGVLNSRIQEGNEFAQRLKGGLLTKSIDDMVNLLAVELDEDIGLIGPNAAQKLPETLEAMLGEGTLTAQQRRTARAIGRGIDAVSQSNLVDTGPWNILVDYRRVSNEVKSRYPDFDEETYNGIMQNQFDLEQTTNYLCSLVADGHIPEDDMVRIFTTAVYHIDFDKVNRQTYLRDNLVHLLHSRPVFEHLPGDISDYEGQFQRRLESRGVGNGIFDPDLENFYRNFRMGELVQKDEWSKHIKDDAVFYFQMAFSNLRHYITERTPTLDATLHVTYSGINSILSLVDVLAIEDLSLTPGNQ